MTQRVGARGASRVAPVPAGSGHASHRVALWSSRTSPRAEAARILERIVTACCIVFMTTRWIPPAGRYGTARSAWPWNRKSAGAALPPGTPRPRGPQSRIVGAMLAQDVCQRVGPDAVSRPAAQSRPAHHRATVIETRHRQGYRFVAEVTVLAQTQSPAPRERRHSTRLSPPAMPPGTWDAPALPPSQHTAACSPARRSSRGGAPAAHRHVV